MERVLNKPPKQIAESEEKESDRALRFLKTRKMRLSEQQIERIEKDISKKYKAYEDSTKTLKKRLTKWNELLEGVVEETNFPFEGASNITIHDVSGRTRSFKSTFNKTMYQDENLFVPVLDPDFDLDRAKYTALQDGFNHSFSRLFNGIDILKDATIPVVRDGTSIIMGFWDRQVERCFDQKVYQNATEFAQDYPDAESAGISEDAYKDIMAEFITSPDEELTVLFDYDFVKFDGIKYKILSLAKFVFFPAFARSIASMEMYGNEYTLSDDELKVKEKRGEIYKSGLEKTLKKKGNIQQDAWDKARNFTEGINIASEEYRPNRVADIVYKTDMDGDGIPEKYLVFWSVDAKVLLSMQPYPIRKNVDMCVDFRIIKRENRFVGISLVGDTEDLFNQLDVIHRHRNNVRMLTTSPVFIAKRDYKELIDMGRAENVIRPGLTLWVDDIHNSIMQLPIANMSQSGDEMDEEQLLVRHIEFAWGITQGLSGMQTAEDPRSPARKTQMLLMQANQRVDDYMDEFRSSLPALAQLHAALLYQYYPNREFAFDKENNILKFPVDLLIHPGVHWKAKRRSVNLTPEFAMARLAQLGQVYMNLLPLLRINDPLAIEMWNRQVLNSGEPEAEKLLYDQQKSEQLMQKSMEMQQQQKDREIEGKAKLKGQTAFKGAIGKRAGEHMAGMLTGTGNQPQNPGG